MAPPDVPSYVLRNVVNTSSQKETWHRRWRVFWNVASINTSLERGGIVTLVGRTFISENEAKRLIR
jgi:hypothetical protein